MAVKFHRFQATIYRIWMMRHIDVPHDIVRELQKQMRRARRAAAKMKPAKSKYIPVLAVVNGKLARTTLVPAGGGRFRMQINTALRKAARADVGDLVGVELRIDRESRELPLPPDLRTGLKAHPKAWRAFQALAPGHRRHFIAWFDSAKSPAARSRRLARAIDFLLERALLGPKRQTSDAPKGHRSRRTRANT
jgi:Bacteriocin-protection, YdeI or OmpD-Associated/Domain of unknown function (DUF1905)